MRKLQIRRKLPNNRKLHRISKRYSITSSSSSSALQPFMSFGLLNYFFPLFPLLRPLFPVLHSHLSQVISRVVIFYYSVLKMNSSGFSKFLIRTNLHGLLTYLLTPRSRVLLEKLTVNFAASREIPRIYGTRNFLTVPTSARHLSLSWANSIQSPRLPPTFWISILILSSNLRLNLHGYIS
jgi:hypothetical protein